MLTKLAVFVGLLACTIYSTKWYFNGNLCKSNIRLDSKVVIVTGANTGIGKETVKDLIERGGKVYLCSRSLQRGNAAAADIKKTTGVGDDRLIVAELDLASIVSIKNFVDDFKRREKRLDVLINNAGVMFVPQSKTEDGFELTFGVNHLGHFLLTTLLTDILIASKPSRVVTVSSYGHTRASMKWDDLMFEKDFNVFDPYMQSKLANILFSRELSKRLEGQGVTTYSLHPGAITTDLMRHVQDWSILGYLFEPSMFVAWPFLKDIPHGAATQVCCAVDENLAATSGKYYSNVLEMVSPNQEANSDEAAQRLWTVSIELLKLNRQDMHPLLR